MSFTTPFNQAGMKAGVFKISAFLISTLGFIGGSSPSSEGTQLMRQASAATLSPATVESDEVQQTNPVYYLNQYSRIPRSFPVQANGSFGYLVTAKRRTLSTDTTPVPKFAMVSLPLPDGATRDVTRARPMFVFGSVGFPHIEKNQRPSGEKYKPYTRLVNVVARDNGGFNIYPNVACKGFSPARTMSRAKPYQANIKKWSKHYGVDSNLVSALITQESCFRNDAVSSAGAAGLMQLMPETASWLGVADSHNPEQNLRAGIRYLASLQREFGSDELALAAYNAGPGNVRRHQGIPPYAETEHYVVTVMHNYRSYGYSERLNRAYENLKRQADS